MSEIGGIAAIEGLLQIRLERIAAMPQRSTAVLIGMLTYDFIKPLTIGSRHILHISNILESPFYLERGSSGLGQRKQVVALVHILQGEQIALTLYLPAISVLQRKAHTTELSTLASVGTSVETMLRSITDAGIADAKGTMNKYL